MINAGGGGRGLVATALAFAAWFTGLRHLSAGTVGLIGLLNPVTGVLLGTAIAGERLATHQVYGLALVFLGILLGQPVTASPVALLHSARRPAEHGCGQRGQPRQRRRPATETRRARSCEPDPAT
ncbi:MAG: DMT family transporter [Micromonosporaceae bacterium]